MFIQQHLTQYRNLLLRFLCAAHDIDRETVLQDVEGLAQALVGQSASTDELSELHCRACASLVDAWPGEPATLPYHVVLHKLARGDAMPALVALLLPAHLSERSLAEQRMHAAHTKLAAMFEQTQDLVLMFNADGEIEFMNLAFECATGWTRGDGIVGRMAVWPFDLPSRGTQHRELLQPCKVGPPFLCMWSVSALHGLQGESIGHVCIGRDTTRLHQLEESLRVNDRLRAVSTLAAGVAHDFNNVLGSIIGLTEMALLDVREGGQSATHLNGVLLASSKASNLVSQLLSYAKEQPVSMVGTDLGEWLAQLRPLLVASLPKQVSLKTEVEGHPQAHIDVAQMDQVLLNLVKNAGYAQRRQGGEVRLKVGEWQDAAAQSWARIEVIDQGDGIEAAMLPRVFDPFFTTKPVGEGTGLGLSVASGIVKRHHGQLLVDSELGKGCVFTLLLPRAQGGPACPAVI